jgi:hypothetical protein
VGPCKHLFIIGKHRNIHMYVAVTGMHVGGNDNQTA